MLPATLDILAFKEQFDPLLAAELDRHIARAAAFTRDEDTHQLLAHIKHMALAGGKRIRPYAAYLMYRTAGGSDADILSTLVAFEIFHTFALIHDDIIDRSALRHGQPAMQAFARSFVSGDASKSEHLSEGLALLAGDIAFSWSRETFLLYKPSVEAQALFDDMIYAVVLGQMLDVKLMCKPCPTEAMIMEKTFLKTAEYTFSYPFRIGAALAEKSKEYGAWCVTMGHSLGIAFQIQDDLLDIIGSENAAGKKLLQDNAEGQPPVLTAYVRIHGADADKAELDSAFGNPVSPHAVVALRSLFERSGAIAYGRKMVAEEIQKSRDTLAELAAGPEMHAVWEALITSIDRRMA